MNRVLTYQILDIIRTFNFVFENELDSLVNLYLKQNYVCICFSSQYKLYFKTHLYNAISVHGALQRHAPSLKSLQSRIRLKEPTEEGKN